jgi:hypothetical protein
MGPDPRRSLVDTFIRSRQPACTLLDALIHRVTEVGLRRLPIPSTLMSSPRLLSPAGLIAVDTGIVSRASEAHELSRKTRLLRWFAKVVLQVM